jgi:hypothetical protein
MYFLNLAVIALILCVCQALPVDWSLVAYFPFDGNAEDQTGLGNLNPTVVNAQLTTDRFGNSNKAYLFDGSSSYISYNSGNIRLGFDKSFSVSFWISPTSDGVIFDSGFQFNQGFRIDYRSGFICFAYKTVSGAIREGNATVVASQWNHVVIGKSTLDIRVYVNNDLVLTRDATSNIKSQVTYPFVIGGQPTTSTIPPSVSSSSIFGGKIDDSCFYWSQLSALEVSLLFNYPSAPSIPTRSPTIMPSRIPTRSPSFAPTFTVTARPTFTSLVAYYPFDGNANDSSGSQIHGTPHNTIPTMDRFGNPNGAYYFDGSSSYISFPVGNFMFTSIMSVSFWIKASPYTEWSGILDLTHYHNEGDFLAGWYVFLGGSNTIVYDFVNPNTGKPDFLETTSVPFPVGTWAHIAIAKTTNLVKFYINGVKTREIPCSSTILMRNDIPLVIGAANIATKNTITPFSQRHFYKGSLDDVSIYSRELTQSEVTVLYTGSMSPTMMPTFSFAPSRHPSFANTARPTFSDFVAHYTFDGNARDSSENRIHGSLYNVVADTDRFGNPRSALKFDGFSSFIMFPAGYFMFTTTMSVSFWMKTNYVSQWTGLLDLTHYYNGDGYAGGWYIFLGSDASITYNFVNPSTGREDFPETNSAPIPLGDWIHIAIVKSVSSVKIFVNGDKKKQFACSSTIATRSDSPLVIGAANLANRYISGSYIQNHFFNGLLDDLYIYSRELTNEEIRSLSAGSASNSDSTSSSPVPTFVWAIIVVVVVLVIGCMISRACLQSIRNGICGDGSTSSSPNTVHVYSNASAPAYVQTIEMGGPSSLQQQPQQYHYPQAQSFAHSKEGYEPIAVAIPVDGSSNLQSSSAVIAMANVERF